MYIQLTVNIPPYNSHFYFFVKSFLVAIRYIIINNHQKIITLWISLEKLENLKITEKLKRKKEKENQLIEHHETKKRKL